MLSELAVILLFSKQIRLIVTPVKPSTMLLGLPVLYGLFIHSALLSTSSTDLSFHYSRATMRSATQAPTESLRLVFH